MFPAENLLFLICGFWYVILVCDSGLVPYDMKFEFWIFPGFWTTGFWIFEFGFLAFGGSLNRNGTAIPYFPVQCAGRISIVCTLHISVHICG